MNSLPLQSKPARDSGGAFTLIELLVVIAIIAILAAMLLPTLAKAKDSAKRITCANNLHMLSLSAMMYVDENDGYFPPRKIPGSWPTRLKDGYQNFKVMQCPNDGGSAATFGTDTNNYPAEAAPRSFIINGWNDYFKYGPQAQTNWADYRAGVSEVSLREAVLETPSETILFGEKEKSSRHYYMDYENYDDVQQLDQSKHMSGRANSGNGGSEYAMVDGSVRYLKFGKAFDPLNLWAVLEEWRVQSVATAP